MLLGVTPMICFKFLRILEKNRKKGKTRKSGQTRAPTPQRGLPSPR